MRSYVKSFVFLLFALLMTQFFSCSQSPTSPYDVSKTTVTLFVQSSDGFTGESAIQDTLGNSLKLGAESNLWNFVDSIQFRLVEQTATSLKDSIVGNKNFLSSIKMGDTIWQSIVFNELGTKTIKLAAYIRDGRVMYDSITLTIVPQAPVNRAPHWQQDTLRLAFSTGNALNVTLTDKCSDADNDQLSFFLMPGEPTGDTILNKTYSFLPTLETPKESYVKIVAADLRGLTDTVVFKVSAEFSDTTPPIMKLLYPAIDGAAVSSNSIDIKILCYDASGLASVSCFKGTDTFAVTRRDSLATVTVTGLQKNALSAISFVAVDSSARANKDTFVVHVKYDTTIADNTPPTLRILSPAKDTVIRADSCKLLLLGKDASGVASVTCAFGASTVIAQKSPTADSIYSAVLRGFTPNQATVVTAIAVDASPASNKNEATVRITFQKDAPVVDSVGPAFIRISGPQSGEIIKNGIISISDSIFDPSGVDSVCWTINGVRAGLMTKVTSGLYSLKDTLTRFHLDTIVLIAQDKSQLRNKSSSVIVVDYNVPPIVRDTAVATSKNTALTFIINAISQDNDPLTWAILSSPQPTSGAITGTLPSMTFTPAANWKGTDSAMVVVTDNQWKDTAKIKITVFDGPVAPQNVKITAQPAVDTIKAGQPITLLAGMNADVNPTPTYQWNHNGTAITGATQVSYAIASAVQADSGSYTVAVTNTVGSSTSAAFKLTVIVVTAPAITTQPSSLSKCSGDSAIFSVVASGTPPLSYQWKKGSAPIGTSQPSYKIQVVAAIDTGSYVCVVSNSAGSVTTAPAAVLSVIIPASISTQPVSATKCINESVQFTVGATGSSPITYQWKKDGTDINGATGASYTIASVAESHAGAYSCHVANGCGAGVNTIAVGLNVKTSPAITTQPTSVTKCAGEAASFTVVASGTAPLSYQWKLGTADISGANSATYPITSVQAANVGSYTCVVTNGCGTGATSLAATLTMNSAPTIGTQPVTPQTICSGGTATFLVAATGAGTLTYQWKKDGNAITGATSASYATGIAGSYTCVVSSGCGTDITSSAGILTVNTPPTIGTQPVSQTTCANQSVTFNVVASGGSLTYQWKKDNNAITGATSASYSTAIAGSYTCTVSNGCTPDVTSSAAILTVNPAPTASLPATLAKWAGETATFTVSATGTGTLTYQWKRGSGNISGATGSSYSISSVGSGDNGATFSCVVTDGCPLSVTSNATTLSVRSVKEAVTGDDHSLILLDDGTLWACGSNSAGQIGNGVNPGRTTPSSIASGVQSIAAGASRSFFIKNDGTLWGCGRNTQGELGINSTTNRLTPIQITTNISAVTTGLNHSLILESGGNHALNSSGNNGAGKLGQGTWNDRDSSFKQVKIYVSNMAAGAFHTLVLDDNGALWACGSNGMGQFGLGTPDGDDHYSLVPVTDWTSGASRIAAGYGTSFVITTGGVVFACGDNGDGQLGDGSTARKASFVSISMPPGSGSVSKVVSGNSHSLFLNSAGVLFACGSNDHGQLGLGTTGGAHYSPVQVLTGVASMSAGFSQSLAVKTDGTLWGCGSNPSGELGDANTADHTSWTQIKW
jgi:alpha-tubulin suppressor-like RCC1 family protein